MGNCAGRPIQLDPGAVLDRVISQVSETLGRESKIICISTWIIVMEKVEKIHNSPPKSTPNLG
jgi:hypothetical protein